MNLPSPIIWVAIAGVALGVLPGATIAAAPDLAVIDAVVLDEQDRTVRGLHQDDFEVRENGKLVLVDSCVEVSALGVAGRADARQIVVLLDDTGIPPELTSTVQRIARAFVSQGGSADRVSVVRLNRRGDEVMGSPEIALERIADYRAGMIPFFGLETFERVLMKVSAFARQFPTVEYRRKLIVAIGSPRVFDIPEPRDRHESLLWSQWVRALTDASRANISLYVIDPAGGTGRIKLSGITGLVAQTGGEAFYNSNLFENAIRRIWDEAGHYYMVSYAPSLSDQSINEVKVTVARRGLHVRARRARG